MPLPLRPCTKLLKKHIELLNSLQQQQYASSRFALLLIFQGMDAAGKDGAIRHVMSGVNPQGCEVVSFKQPSATDLAHDFLWRTTVRLPEKGRIAIYNRSHYEEVLITRVHPTIVQAEGVALARKGAETFWEGRYRSIVNFEEHLHRNATHIVKFFLHVSKEEQRKRLLARIDDAAKNWKFEMADVEERRFWTDYMSAYEHCLSATSTRDAFWYVAMAASLTDGRVTISGARYLQAAAIPGTGRR